MTDDRTKMSEEDKAALERYQNYVASMKVANSNKTKEIENASTIEEKTEMKRKHIIDDKDLEIEEKKALERYENYVAKTAQIKNQKRKKKKSFLRKDVSAVAWKIRLIFIILAMAFLFWAMR